LVLVRERDVMRSHLPVGHALGLLAITLVGCAHVGTPALRQYDLSTGYRFEQLAHTPPDRTRKNSDDVFVVLALSGGGTRAAALSTGVLGELASVTFHLNPKTGQPCTPGPQEPDCEMMPRSLLDEVDVISSVSGGSFAAAYYALHGVDILNRNSRFQHDFLYYPIQRDLFAQAVFYPSSWPYLGMRTEIAARLYQKRVFDGATFGMLAHGGRPYIILNGTDSTTGARFEFTQEQFDLLCADLNGVPVARGVTGSSAFPGLLNTLTIESHNRAGCHYGCRWRSQGWREEGHTTHYDESKEALIGSRGGPRSRLSKERESVVEMQSANAIVLVVSTRI